VVPAVQDTILFLTHDILVVETAPATYPLPISPLFLSYRILFLGGGMWGGRLGFELRALHLQSRHSTT
jgi:hypothetical protein